MNLRQIDGAKQQWAYEHHATTNDTPAWEDLKPYFARGQPPRCPHRGSYSFGRVGELPTCSVADHTAYFRNSVEKSEVQ
jgi:hypothetical protein